MRDTRIIDFEVKYDRLDAREKKILWRDILEETSSVGDLSKYNPEKLDDLARIDLNSHQVSYHVRSLKGFY